MTVTMPPRLLLPRTAPRTLYQLISHIEPDESFKLYHDDQKYLLGYFIPPFQREIVWSLEQMTRFIESAWLGVHLGSYLVNEIPDAPMTKVGGHEKFHKAELWLLDGQQRLTAIDRYLRDEFAIFGARWSELSDKDRRRFQNTTFDCSLVSLTDEDDLRRMYDTLNFGGVAHTEDQRAVPGPKI